MKDRIRFDRGKKLKEIHRRKLSREWQLQSESEWSGWSSVWDGEGRVNGVDVVYAIV